jgi:glucose 1-dehydrogenase
MTTEVQAGGAPELFDLTGRVALVTGSSRGIGRAIALALAGSGADVAVHCATRAEDAEAVAQAIRRSGRRSAAFAADLADAAACAQLTADVAGALGAIDILVLNASMEIRRDWLEIGEADFSAQVAVNLRSTLLLLQATLPGMAERGWGRVVTLGSIQEAKPNPRLVLYAALKAAQTSMVVNLARQYAASGVTLNNLAPGAILTERNAAVLEDPGYRTRVEAQIPAGRVGTPEDCVGATLLLCSEAGRYITGSTLFVDGGWHVG